MIKLLPLQSFIRAKYLKWTSLTLLLFMLSCHTRQAEKTFSIRQDALDSFRLLDIIDSRELFNLTSLNDTELMGFSNHSMFLGHYTKQGKNFRRNDSFFIPNSFHFEAFFADQDKKLHFIGRDSEYAVNKWYVYDLETRKLELKHLLDIKLPVLQQFRIFHLQHQPVMMDERSYVLDVASIDPFTFKKDMAEKVYLQVFLNHDTIKRAQQFLEKPASLIGHIMPYNIHCLFGSKVLTIFPCIDTIYAYDLGTKESERIPISNPNFCTPLYYDRKRWREADYNTKIRLQSFYYQGIFFNEGTNHLVLFYTMPADKNIKVPTYEDKQLYALVLDTNYQFVKNIRFTDKFWSTGKFFNTKQGIYMLSSNKDERDEKKCTYYLFDL